MYPDGVKFWVGPSVEGGFYYDVDFGEHTLSATRTFRRSRKKMLELAQAEKSSLRPPVRCTKSEAIAYFEDEG